MVNVTNPQDLSPLQRKLRGIPASGPEAAPGEPALPTLSERLRLTNSVASPKPDESARILRAAARLGVDRDLVAANLEEAEGIAARKDFNPESLDNDPILARWYAESPHHMSVAKGDMSPLKNLSKLYYRKDNPLRPMTEEEFESLAQRIGKRQAVGVMQTIYSDPAVKSGAVSPAYKTVQDAEPVMTERARESLREIEGYVTGEGKAGAFASPGSVLRKIPIAGAGVDLAEASLLASMKRIQDGTATEEDEDAILLFGRLQAAAASRGQTFGGKVLEGIAELPGFAAEFAMTGGVYRAGKVGAEIALRKTLQKVLTGRARGLVRAGLGAAVGGAAQTVAQAGLFSLPADAMKRMAPGVEITPDDEGKLKATIEGDGEDILPAVSKAFGARFVENLSERTGVAVTKLIAPVKAAVASRWFKLNPGKPVSQFLTKVSKATGWNGVIEEVFEERVGEVGRAALGIEEYKLPTAEDFAAEVLTLATPAGGAAAIRGAAGLRKAKQQRDFFKNGQATIREAKSLKLAPEAIEDLVGRLAEGGGVEFAYVPARQMYDAMAKAGKPPKQEILSLGVSESAFDRAIETGGDLQIPMAPFMVRVLAQPHGDALVKVARTSPEVDTVEEAEAESKAKPREIPVEAAPSAPAAGEAPTKPQGPTEITPKEADVKDATPEEWDDIKARAKLADDHIKEAAAAQQALMSFFPDKHKDAIEKARGAARQAMIGKLTDSIRKKRTAEYKADRAKTKGEVEAEVNDRKEYVALSILRKGTLPSGAPAPIAGLKISRDALRLDFPALTEGNLPRGVLAERGEGAHPDELAELLGYSSGSELLMALIDAEYRFPRETLIEELTDARMAEKSEALEADPAKTQEEAIRALHNTERSKLLIQDLKQLVSKDFSAFKDVLKRVVGEAPAVFAGKKKGATGDVPKLSDITKWAETEVRKETFRTLHPGVYRQQAKLAARKALDAFLAGDFQEAFNQRLLELKSNELAIAAQNLQEEARKIPKFMRRFQKKEVQQELGFAGAEKYLDPIEDLIERFEFSPASARKVEERKSFREWYENEVKEGRSPVVPDKLIFQANRTNWKDVKLSDLLEMKTAVENIAHLAKLKNTLLTAKERKAFDATVKALVGSMVKARGDRPAKKEPLSGTSTMGERIRQRVAKGIAQVMKASNIALELDGWKHGGPMWESFILPLNKAQEREQDMAIKGDEALTDILSTYSRKERRQMRRREYIPAVKDSLSKWDRIAVALNWGNADNQEALQAGYGWSRAQVENVLSTLTERDWQVVQKLWDHLDTYWPEIKALSERADGIAPEKIQAQPFTATTSDGKTVKMKGGYYPLKYKPDPSKPHDSIEEIVDQSMRGGTWRASTRHGFRKERQGSGGRQVRLDLGVLTEHQRDVIHDITHHEWLIDANKLLRNPDMVDAIKGNVGAEHYDELLQTMNAVALNNRQSVNIYDKGAEWMARRTRAATLVANVGTILKQYLGLLSTVTRIGPGWTMRGLHAAGFGTQQTKDVEEWMAGLSTFMKNRRGSQDRDQAEVLKKALDPAGEPSAVGGAVQGIERFGFSLIGATQWHVDRATWLGAYQKYAQELGLENAQSAEERDKIEERIVSMADQAVRDSQGSGLLADLPAVMRSRGAMRLFTLFRTFAVNQLNLFASKVYPAARRPSPAAIGQAATALVSLYVIPTLLWDLARKSLVGGGDGDEEENILKKAATTAPKEFLNSVPLLGEIAPAVDLVTGEGARDYRGPSGLTLVAESLRLAAQLGQVVEDGEEQLDTPLLRSALRASGLPGSMQVDKMIGGYLSWEDNESEIPAILLGRALRK